MWQKWEKNWNISFWVVFKVFTVKSEVRQGLSLSDMLASRKLTAPELLKPSFKECRILSKVTGHFCARKFKLRLVGTIARFSPNHFEFSCQKRHLKNAFQRAISQDYSNYILLFFRQKWPRYNVLKCYLFTVRFHEIFWFFPPITHFMYKM